METIWKFYKDTDYRISDIGQVLNTRKNVEVTPFPNKDGYLLVNLWDKGRNIIISVHRLVAETFIENPLSKREVNHIDGIKTNNTAINLEWNSSSENKQHGIRTGLYKTGELAYQTLLKESDVIEILSHLKSGSTNNELALKYHVNDGTISEIRLNRSWKSIVREALPLSGPNPIKKLAGRDIPDIREMFLTGQSDAEIGRKYKVARATINQIRQGNTWKNY